MNFQLYRGNLHKVPDVPRRWPLAKPTISLQVFKKAIAKRQEALLVVQQFGGDQPLFQHGFQALVLEEDVAVDEDGHGYGLKRKREHSETSGIAMELDEDLDGGNERRLRMCAEADGVKAEDMAVDCTDGIECQPSLRFATDLEVRTGGEAAEMDANETVNVSAAAVAGDSNVEKEGERLEAPRTPVAKDEDGTKPIERAQTRWPDGCNSSGEVSFMAAKKLEIQETLKQLQETKHQLVQILKQVLIKEEESKRKSQGFPQFWVPYAAGGTGDLSLEHKMGFNLQSADLEEGELDYTRNPGPPAVASSYGSHFSEFLPQALGTMPGRHFNHQLSK